MKKILFAAVILGLAVSGTVSAHVHPTVPNECALGAGAGNTAAPANGTNRGGPFAPPLPGLILNNNPSAVDGSAVGPGVGPATANCKNF